MNYFIGKYHLKCFSTCMNSRFSIWDSTLLIAIVCTGLACTELLPFPETDTLGDTVFTASGHESYYEAIQIAAGVSHTRALSVSGTVRCWGDGQYGQLGQGNTDRIGYSNVPADVGIVPVL